MEFTQRNLDMCEAVFKYGNPVEFDYWIKRINQRLNFLNPLIHELTLKGINLIDISKELNHEYNTLIMLKTKYL